MLYPPQFIERLRDHFLLSELIGRRVALKKAGREYSGLCPFHGEKTPSFTVNNEKGFFHCFGCAAHGDAIEFVKRYDNLSWREAIEKLAGEAGIAVPQMSREEVEKEQAAKSLLDVMEVACAWFEKNVSATEHSAVRDYVQQRGITTQTRQLFRIGYAPDGREGLKRQLLSQGFPEAQLLECGLIIAPESGPSYDRFRSRLMFPIRNAKGRVIAFGGRLMGDSQARHAPKYLNSPETPLFHKSQVLFNLDQAAKAARDKNEIVIVEGYMDCVSMVQAGIAHSVATLGTAVTAEHLRKLWQYAAQPVLCLDGDAAGQRAMMRTAEMSLPLLAPDKMLRFAVLSQGEDPDSYVQKYGSQSFKAFLKQTEKTGTLSYVLWHDLHKQHDASSAEGLASLRRACAQTLHKVTDSTVRKELDTAFRGHLKHYDDLLWKKNRTPARNEQPRSAQVVQVAVTQAPAPFDALLKQMLHILRKFPALAHKGQVEETLSMLEIHDPRLDALRHALLSILHDDHHDHESAIVSACAGLPDDRLFAMRSVTTLEQAEQQLEKIIFACALGHSQMEMEKAQAILGQAWDETALVRMQELQRQHNTLIEKGKMLHATPEDN